MKHFLIDSYIDSKLDIPNTISTGLRQLFDVNDISDLSENDKNRIRSLLKGLYTTTSGTDYSNVNKEYALYYLPVNLYKIWRPLMDLLLTDSLPIKCSILELGAGPGSATFGLLEFYKYLAIDNPVTVFSLHITLIERDMGFIGVYNSLYDGYVDSLPDNLCVDICCVHDDAYSFTTLHESGKYQLVIESNMLNQNEYIDADKIFSFTEGLKKSLSRHSSVILIEPAKKESGIFLKRIKKAMQVAGLACYSPCSCVNTECGQFASARVDISGVSIYSELVDSGIISRPQAHHSFEYAIFRNDGLKKYSFEGTGTELQNLANRIGEVIKVKAFILTIGNETEDSFSLKLCDGSLNGSNEVWLSVPKKSLVEKEINCLTIGRGGIIDAKNVVITGPRNLQCTQITKLRIMM
ncbi:MAG: hypothetical protein PHV71_08340 [Eubacteriales bacterium]|nr:hypothetical protein [Eubacteriales bacterium]